MRKSPVTVQEWLDALPAPTPMQQQEQLPENRTTSPIQIPMNNAAGTGSARPSLRLLARDASFQSDDCSHCSSVESVLELRKPDPEAVLLGLGFGPPTNGNNFSRIPSRFQQPSKLLTKIDINTFLEQQGEQQQSEFNSSLNLSNLGSLGSNLGSNPSSPARVKPTFN